MSRRDGDRAGGGGREERRDGGDGWVWVWVLKCAVWSCSPTPLLGRSSCLPWVTRVEEGRRRGGGGGRGGGLLRHCVLR